MKKVVVCGVVLLVLVLDLPVLACLNADGSRLSQGWNEPSVGNGSKSRGVFRFHFYVDSDDDGVYDENEASPSYLFVRFHCENLRLGSLIPRFKIARQGDVTFRSVAYPAAYGVHAEFNDWRMPGIPIKLVYGGILNLSQNEVGTPINLPLTLVW